ncbi:hypothetical protein M0208_15280 [Sphingomonas sp. SUN019]|uniref:tetratricopeptide repeat protein n=1 Tax=Sphingomonas sp. SUN019 TaxID=2937788 RepID=UPI0021646C63|nr:hypothetical protein [Sphingomonas sp. SUN019]UVO51805.1 hypothetical protein M0208_15280 [Sphingomonas sp. SUN019]
MMKRFWIVAAGLAIAAAAPLRATPQEIMGKVTDPAERALLPEIGEALGSGQPSVTRLDALIARLPQPTPLRGLVQTARANLLLQSNRMADAGSAIEEAMRLLPDEAFPKLVASVILTFSGGAPRAADLWLEASKQAPEMARHTDDYLAGALLGRLREIGDTARADRLAARMGEIGIGNLLSPMRSSAALARVKAEAAAHGAVSAERFVRDITATSDMAELYVDRRYAALWPTIAAWGGPSLDRLRLMHLEELRREWQTSQDYRTATNYARALMAVEAFPVVIDLFAPLLTEDKLAKDDASAEFLAVPVARAFDRLGRSAERDAILRRVDAALPPDAAARRLNLSGSPITNSFMQHRWNDVVTHADAWMAAAKALGPEVNRSATINVVSMRACARIGLGQAQAGALDIAEVMIARSAIPSAALRIYLCQDDLPKAVALVQEALTRESDRGWALLLLQPDRLQDTSIQGRAEFAFLERLRKDVGLRAAAEKVGRILPQPLASGLPTGFDPLAPAITPRDRTGNI